MKLKGTVILNIPDRDHNTISAGVWFLYAKAGRVGPIPFCFYTKCFCNHLLIFSLWLSSPSVRTRDHDKWSCDQRSEKHLICTVKAHFLALAPFHLNVCGHVFLLYQLTIVIVFHSVLRLYCILKYPIYSYPFWVCYLITKCTVHSLFRKIFHWNKKYMSEWVLHFLMDQLPQSVCAGSYL